jgi:CRP-like cAMP-binding protein
MVRDAPKVTPSVPRPGVFKHRRGTYIDATVKTLRLSRLAVKRLHLARVTAARVRLTSRLRAHGERRRAAEATSERELGAIAKLLPEAIEVGISKAEIARLTGVSRPTIDAILRDRAR